MAAIQLLPSTNWDGVHFVRDLIKSKKPGFARVQAAWLFPDGDITDFTNIRRRLWIRVPIALNKRRAYNLEDLETEMWMNLNRVATGPTSDIDRNSVLVDRFPFDKPHPLEFAFYVLVADQSTSGPYVYPENGIINRWLPDLPQPWRGNVIVFKRGKGHGHPIINISEQDTTFVEAIVKRVIRDGLQTWNHLMPSLRSNRLMGRRAAALIVWRVPELYEMIVKCMTLITLAHFRAVSKASKEDVHEILGRRVVLYTSPFFPRAVAHSAFMDLINELESIIVGSVPLCAMSMPLRPDCPDNLNVIATFNTFARWMHAMLYLFNFYVLFEGDCDGPYRLAGYRFIRFKHPDLMNTVTITFSNLPDLWELEFSAPNSCQWNVITGRTLICPTVNGTSLREGVIGCWARHQHFSANHPPMMNTLTKITASLDVDFVLYEDTDDWQKPCGWLCPGRWRYARACEGVGCWSWGGVQGRFEETDTIMNRFALSSFKWSLGDTCLNVHCGFSARGSLVEH
ncbi:hypothetical protein C8F04DRAFT_1279708 [Mycena alexandri]|uniref:Uncharacterized protein n=1 Tax=Mycena alexandri TaxID=1745969 RepID=A0AAD6WLT4_9AGAR|nr:hypothetical protein C8F04DRAFT_1279708 [Mycena alexandri]